MTRMISALPVVIMIQSMDTMTAENMETAFGASIPLHANDDIVVRCCNMIRKIIGFLYMDMDISENKISEDDIKLTNILRSLVVFFLIYSGKYLIRRMWYMEILWMSQERYQQQIKVFVLSSSNTQRIIFSC